jgi:anti-sigma regulatory factor (Ser/Thr protein kinase)
LSSDDQHEAASDAAVRPWTTGADGGYGGESVPECLPGQAPVISGRPLGAQLAMAVDLQLGVLVAAELVPGGLCPEIVSRAGFASDPACPASRTFPGTSDQLAAVRRFVRSEFAGHPALDDSVLVASELAANAIAHTRSGHDGGTFTVHLGMMSSTSVCILVADEGGPTVPNAQRTGIDAESGRGLDLVAAVSAIFVPAGDGNSRNVIVIITADPDNQNGNDDEERHA